MENGGKGDCIRVFFYMIPIVPTRIIHKVGFTKIINRLKMSTLRLL